MQKNKPKQKAKEEGEKHVLAMAGSVELSHASEAVWGECRAVVQMDGTKEI